jgi:hypothetical protein
LKILSVTHNSNIMCNKIEPYKTPLVYSPLQIPCTIQSIRSLSKNNKKIGFLDLSKKLDKKIFPQNF